MVQDVPAKLGNYSCLTRYFVLALVSPMLAACGGGGGTPVPIVVAPSPPPVLPPPPPPPPPPVSSVREIDPAVVDPTLQAGQSPNYTINPDPSVAQKGRLFVMLPGTTAVPRNYRLIVQTGAKRGYHSLGLTYPNAITVADYCAAITDPDCTGNVRREIITGENVSAQVTIDRANSIAGRLTNLITFMNRTYPTEGWGQYLVGGNVDWSKVSVAGHSQGSGHAAYLGKLFSLDRIVMYSGPADVPVQGGASARWLSLPNVTPLARVYGFTHRDDNLVPFALATFNWDVLGIGSFGAPTSVDGAAAPYGGSHELFSTAAPNPNPIGVNFSSTHGAPAVDNVTPITAQGTPLYEPVWAALSFP